MADRAQRNFYGRKKREKDNKPNNPILDQIKERARVRKERRMVEHKNRPQKPIHDPIYLEIVEALKADKRSRNAQANVSGLSATTLKKWISKEVKRPQGVSLQMAARMLGMEIVLRRKL